MEEMAHAEVFGNSDVPETYRSALTDKHRKVIMEGGMTAVADNSLLNPRRSPNIPDAGT